MSRSNKTIENPCQKYFEWSGSKAQIYYWDKEQEKEVPVDLPFPFLMLEIMYTIRGWNKDQKSGIYSNEVRSLKQPLKVKTHKGFDVAEGLWDDIKNTINGAGGKFANSVYIAYKDENEKLRIGNFMFVGSSLGPWIDLQKKYGRRTLEETAVVITGSHEEQNGTTTYHVPEMSLKKVSPEMDRLAIQLDKLLQEYLDSKVDHVDLVDSEEDPELEQQSDVDMSEYRNGGQPMPDEQLYGEPKGGEDMLADVGEDLPF